MAIVTPDDCPQTLSARTWAQQRPNQTKHVLRPRRCALSFMSDRRDNIIGL